MVRNFNLEKTYQFLLIALAFLMPLTVFGGNLIILIIVTLWVISGKFKEKFYEIIQSKFLLASILFFTVMSILNLNVAIIALTESLCNRII